MSGLIIVYRCEVYGLALAPLLQYWGAMLLTWEASTPLMNARWAFIKLKLTQHPAFQYIQVGDVPGSMAHGTN